MSKTGRPSKYNPSFIPEAINYLASTGKEQMTLPTIEGFALWLGVHRDTLYEWAKHEPIFSDTLRNIEHVQKQQLINDGIYGGKEVNATIVKLLLQNNHGMREKTETELSGGITVMFHNSLKQEEIDS